MNSKTELATRAALGLASHFLDSPVSLGDVRLFALGRLHLWPGWSRLSETDRLRIARFLSFRPGDLGEDGPLFEHLRREIDAGNDFERVADGPAGRWDTTFAPVAGRPLVDRLDSWLHDLGRLDGRRGPSAVDADGASDIQLLAEGRTYRVSRGHLPRGSNRSIRLSTHRPVPTVELQASELRALARLIDSASNAGPRFEDVAVRGFLDRFLRQNGEPVTALSAGPTQIAMAPTGSGKSVYARLLALSLASGGETVALVVPDVQAVWKECLRLTAAARAASLSLRIAPLSSWRDLAAHVANHLAHPPAEDADGRWALGHTAYVCHLAAYTEPEEDAPPPGEEPCTRLRQRGRKSSAKDSRVECPFAGQCGRFAGFAAAADADIIVVNHHAFLSGRVPIEVSIDAKPARKISTAELVLRKSAVIIIDEVDAFQDNAIGANSHGLVLSSRGNLSKPIQLYTEVERRRAENRVPAGLRFERGRSALLRIMNEAERLSELVNRKELDWPERGHMTWREAHDAWIAGRLFRESDDGLERVRRLFDRADGEPLETHERRLQRALAPLAGPGLGDGMLMEEIRPEILVALAEWPGMPKGTSDSIQSERSRIVDRLVVRAILLQVDRALGHLRPQLPGLEQQEIEQAAELRDALLGYAPWQPSPTGPLGQRLYGYAFSERLGEQGALETHVLSGDPHGLVQELGGVVAHALAGTERIVLGLSATCRFRGSPRADVTGELVGAVRDEARNVSIIQAAVAGRISGIGSRAERLDAANQAARELWTTTLGDYLHARAADPTRRGRARALVVTGSYDEAIAVARGLRQVCASTATIRYLVRDGAETTNDGEAVPRRQLELFGDVSGPAVLVGPLSVVARGHNILQPGTQHSALSGIFVLTRPVPPSHDADRFLAHVSYNARLSPPAWQGTASATIAAERNDAWRRLRALQKSPATFRHMDPELRRELVCDVLVELAQLAGRARRGGTPVDLVFVDGAFQDEVVPWRELVADVLAWWKEHGWLDEMMWLHGAFLHGLADYAGFSLAEAGGQCR